MESHQTVQSRTNSYRAFLRPDVAGAMQGEGFQSLKPMDSGEWLCQDATKHCMKGEGYKMRWADVL
jgi:hypothetical protein